MKRLSLTKKVLGGLLGAAAFFPISCKEEEKVVLPVYEAGVLISNGSATNTPGGSVSYYDRATGTVEPDLFNKVNGRSLEGNVMTMASAFEKTYLITSNQKIEVLHTRTFTSAGVIQGLTAPQRFVAFSNRLGFVSEAGAASATSGRVMEVNLSTYQITDTITTGKNPGAMALVGTRLYVANGHNKISVINTTNDRTDTTLTVGDNPNSMVVDASGFLWVLCAGKVDATNPGNNTRGRLIRITTTNLRAAPRVFEFPGAAFQPRNLALSITRNRLYFVYDGVYVMETAATALPKEPLIPRRFQALGQDPTDGLLYTSRTDSDGISGWVIRYRPTGAAVDSFQVQGIPTGFGFR
ncbi:DUF5074 domain-containing protein [Rufibacter sp. XAAS-G3-1]|uniref:DUF5074 domain-containing protein n=1 Tax=Rufibacter sp. XAAS-G3-1 TaxID=2729134 RepID=UPI0015E7428F|nr:DUF5074 domain-containing protein [Rufibacter sp. XAAS-G3-1]